LCLDWRGHGASDPADGEFGFEALERDARAVIDASGVAEVIPVATAHAGWVALALRRALGPERVPRLVLFDWIVTAAPPPFLAGLAALQAEDRWRAVRDQLFSNWLAGVSHPGVARFVHEDMGSYDFAMWSRAGRAIATAYAREGSPLEALARLEPSTPTLHAYAQPDDPGFLTAQRAFAAAHPWFEVHKIDASSHFPTLEVPDRVAELVEGALSR
jgi:pimeloyl-ACP methyl ester carboxylesterase